MGDSDSISNPGTNVEEPGNIFSALLNIFPVSSTFAWNIQIWLEAMLITILSLFVVQALGVPESGLIGLSLASAAMVPRFNTILAINRERIWAAEGTGRRVNSQSALSCLSIFSGMFVGFLLIAIITDYQSLQENFGFVLRETGFKPGDVLSPERFELGTAVVAHNIIILLAFGILALLYRSLGTMIAVGWNSSVWAITLTLFIKSGSGSDTSQFLTGLIIILAIMPHLIVEALGYISGALCGIFLSRGITIYDFFDPRLKRVMIAVLVLAVVAIVLIIVAGLIENSYAPYILELID